MLLNEREDRFVLKAEAHREILALNAKRKLAQAQWDLRNLLGSGEIEGGDNRQVFRLMSEIQDLEESLK